jgi:cytoskeletal protein CcmA (bactofilin family)
MFRIRQRGTVIAEGLRIAGNVTAEGHIEVHGKIDGEVRGTSVVISKQARVTGPVLAEEVVVDGHVNGAIHGGRVTLKSQAHVTGDIHYQSLAIEKGARFDGRSMQDGNKPAGEQEKHETPQEKQAAE